MINECNNIIRKNKKVTYIEDSQINNEVYEDKYKNIDLIRAIDSLRSDLRITMWLFYFDDMSIEEISNALKIPKGTIKSRLNRGREKIIILWVRVIIMNNYENDKFNKVIKDKVNDIKIDIPDTLRIIY